MCVYMCVRECASSVFVTHVREREGVCVCMCVKARMPMCLQCQCRCDKLCRHITAQFVNPTTNCARVTNGAARELCGQALTVMCLRT